MAVWDWGRCLGLGSPIYHRPLGLAGICDFSLSTSRKCITLTFVGFFSRNAGWTWTTASKRRRPRKEFGTITRESRRLLGMYHFKITNSWVACHYFNTILTFLNIHWNTAMSFNFDQSVTELPGRHLIFDGDLAELDPESFTTIGKIHIFLLNDSLMIATWLPHRYVFPILSLH